MYQPFTTPATGMTTAPTMPAVRPLKKPEAPVGMYVCMYDMYMVCMCGMYVCKHVWYVWIYVCADWPTYSPSLAAPITGMAINPATPASIHPSIHHHPYTYTYIINHHPSIIIIRTYIRTYTHPPAPTPMAMLLTPPTSPSPRSLGADLRNLLPDDDDDDDDGGGRAVEASDDGGAADDDEEELCV